MTLPTKYDVFPIDLLNARRRFFAVLIQDVTLETSVEIFDHIYRRGIYAFDTKKARDLFTRLCNDAIGSSVAYRFNCKPTEKENGNEH